MKDKGFKILFVVNVLLFFTDLGTTLINWDVFKYLETNPLYRTIGISGLIILNGLLFLGSYYFYTKYKSPDLRFMLTFALSLLLLMRIPIIINNWRVFLNPPSIEVAMSYTTQVKVQQYVNFVIIPAIMPYFVSMLTWLCFRIDHKIEAKE